MNIHAENLTNVSTRITVCSTDDVKIIRDAAAEIERLEKRQAVLQVELDSCRSSNDAMHPRLVRCEEALLKISESLAEITLNIGPDGDIYCETEHLSAITNAAIAQAKAALEGSETPPMFTREQVRPLVEALVRVREMMQAATMTKPSYAAEIRRDARLAVAEINKALDSSAETMKGKI